MFISFQSCKDFLNELKNEMDVFVPAKSNDGIDFELFNGENVVFDYVNTKTPPKSFFFPEEDIIFHFKKLKGKIIISLPKISKKILIFGVRPCDSYALWILDKVLLKKDLNYTQRRKKTFIICVECEKAGKNCFCYAFNVKPKVFDLLFSPTKNGFLVKVGSEKGRRLMKKYSHFFEKRGKFLHVFPKKFYKKFDLKKVEKKLPSLFSSEKWKKIAEYCLACTACTAVCPTCYCFDIKDEENVRKRVWSSCFLLEFTRVAGNFYFRKERSERVKQFVYHKLYYFKKAFGVHLCVGCGRCIDACPVFIDFFDHLMKMVKK